MTATVVTTALVFAAAFAGMFANRVAFATVRSTA